MVAKPWVERFTARPSVGGERGWVVPGGCPNIPKPPAWREAQRGTGGIERSSWPDALGGRLLSLRVTVKEAITMVQEHIGAGTRVAPGKYRCNACANEVELNEEGDKLPQCRVCDSISWRTYRLKEKAAAPQKG